jgi:hypothetical protein
MKSWNVLALSLTRLGALAWHTFHGKRQLQRRTWHAVGRWMLA